MPPPSMSEFRAFLSGCGLTRRGDAAMYLVLPALHPDHLLDRVEIKLVETGDPLRLDVSLVDTPERRVTVGSLYVSGRSPGGLQCLNQQAPRGRLWSFWPMTPQPLLP